MMLFLLPVAQYQHPYLDLGENMSDFDIFSSLPRNQRNKNGNVVRTLIGFRPVLIIFKNRRYIFSFLQISLILKIDYKRQIQQENTMPVGW